jgi:drug/metabolite transporter (DMT)-like permease
MARASAIRAADRADVRLSAFMVNRPRGWSVTLGPVQSVAVGIPLALAASVALNTSFLVQHAGAVDVPAVSLRRPLATLRALAGSPTWLGGLGLGCAGWALYVGALARAPLSLVQAFVAGGVALTVPLAAVGLKHRVGPRERHAIGLMVFALVLLSLGLRGGRQAGAPPVPLAGAILALVACAAALALGVRGERRPMGLGVAGGLLYGAADIATKALTGVAEESGGAAVISSPLLIAAAAATVTAFFAFQRSLQAPHPVVVIGLMTGATNVSTIAGGLVVFGDPLGATPALATLHLVALVLVTTAAWRLVPAQATLAAGGGHRRGPGRTEPTGSARGRHAS